MNVKNEQKQPKTLKIGYFIFWHFFLCSLYETTIGVNKNETYF
jgi:hypothetical protein